MNTARANSPNVLQRLALIALSVALLLPGCAWQNPDNRRLWNAFEKHWVPEDDTSFYLALPLTVPAGVVAILLDVVIVHPASIVGDAWQSATVQWDDIDWQDEYWFQTGVAPFRGVITVLHFVGELVGRSFFDIPAFEPADAAASQADHASAVDRLAVAAQEQEQLSTWLAGLLRGELVNGPARSHVAFSELPWDGELSSLAARVLTDADVRARMLLYTWARRSRPTGFEDPWLALRDHDARVRASALVRFGDRAQIPEEYCVRLLADPDPVVAELAWQLGLDSR